jgi:hypothetical protein
MTVSGFLIAWSVRGTFICPMVIEEAVEGLPYCLPHCTQENRKTERDKTACVKKSLKFIV